MSNSEQRHETKVARAGEAQRVEPGEEMAAPAPGPEDLDARQQDISEKRRSGGPPLDEEPEPEEDAAAAGPVGVDETSFAPVPGGD